MVETSLILGTIIFFVLPLAALVSHPFIIRYIIRKELGVEEEERKHKFANMPDLREVYQ